MSDYSDQEIDLRPYVAAVLSKWYWILGLGLLAGILAYAATSMLQAPVYEATALVSVIEPRQRVQFDPRIVTIEDEQPLRAYPEIAVSDDILMSLRNEVPALSSFTLQRLRAMIEATSGKDPSLLRLTARNRDPELASEVANNWAVQFVVWANRTYGDSSEDQLLFFEQQLNSSAEDLQLSEDALVEYQAQNRSAILDNELQALRQTHANLLAKKEEIELLARDLESLRAASGG
ncbi:MAG: Wzz/FepE/Etk N-terminal domain-containing protein, partial [Candidatus Promineifilaceae bacterium]|nr:Wzz/FepE/Etk N-terminal domain-containing protein [Candidatus Promineifilaceae bacterium]